MGQVLDTQQKHGQGRVVLYLLLLGSHGLPPALGEKLETSVGDVRALSRAGRERPSPACGQDEPSPAENLGQALLGILSSVKKMA